MRAAIACAALLISATAYAQPAWRPEKQVEIVIGSGPGGGNDRNARAFQKILNENKYLQNVSIINKVGGGGALAYTYVNQHANDAHYVVFVRQGFLSNHILGRSPIAPADMTPLAMLTTEASSLAVRASNAALKSIADVLERLKHDPQSLTTSLGSTRAGTPHLALAMLAKAGGIDARRLKLVTFSGGAESAAQLLGGHIDMAAVSIDNTAPHHKSGAMRILGVSSAQRLAALPDVPTFKEQGYDVVMGGFTIVMGPRGLTAAQIQYWENLLERASNTTEWKRMMAADLQDLDFRKSAATRDYLRQQYEVSRTLLADIGMTK
ncbi:MAG TPA: tripartite tricarboxylate transporter substrate binding protein [Burkholderiales bacterium]|nr:tripartite tricarboxylate transporter substrate binding protein [Burkholderiales bacterium]